MTNSDEVGNFFYLSLQSDVNLSFFCDDLWRSTSGGQSWTLRSGERGAGGGDKQWLTIDKTNGPGHGFQYQADDGINRSVGDADASRVVAKADLTLVQGQLNQPVTTANFREDLTADGRIKNADVNLVKTNKGHSIP